MVAGRRVVVTGKIAGESRETAETKLREAGAIVQGSVGKNTDLLITGAAVGASKMKKAYDLGVMAIPWEQAFGTNPVIGVMPPPREPAPAVRVWAPMLAKAGTLPEDGEKWLYEVKWDGYRGIATVKGGSVMIQSRSGKSDLTAQFPEVANELAMLDDCVLDGELVAIDAAGESTFETLHRNQGTSATRYIVFDVLEVKGSRVTGMTLTARRELLAKVLEPWIEGPRAVGQSPGPRGDRRRRRRGRGHALRRPDPRGAANRDPARAQRDRRRGRHGDAQGALRGDRGRRPAPVAGLDDKTLELLAKVDVGSLAEANLQWRSVGLLFLPDELERATAALEDALEQVSADELWLARVKEADRVLDALAEASIAHDIRNHATALAVVMAVYERHRTELRDGWLDDATFEPRHKGLVPLASVFGSDRLPSATAARLAKAVSNLTGKGEIPDEKPWMVLEKLMDAWERNGAEEG